MFISPDINGGNKSTSPVEFIDIFPTLCDLVSQEIPKHLHGLSLKTIMKNPKISVKSSAMSQWPSGNGMGYALRNERFRYVEWMTGDTKSPYNKSNVFAKQLFDYKKDPYETVNIADESTYKDVADHLQKELSTYFKN